MLWRFVEGVADAGMFFFQFLNLFWLTLEGYDREFVAIKVREHVPTNVENQYPFAIFELGKRELLLNTISQRKAIFTVFFNVHGC